MRKIQILALIFLATASAFFLQAQAQDTDEIGTLNGQVVRLYQAGKYAEAIVVARKALKLSEQKFGPDHPDVGVSLNNLAAQPSSPIRPHFTNRYSAVVSMRRQSSRSACEDLFK